MSSDRETGDAKFVGDIVADAKQLLADAAVDAEQLDLLDPLSPDEIAAARDELGPEAGRLAVLRHATERKRGRPPGSRNKRNLDFEKYIRAYGPDPAVVMMQIMGSDPEVLVENSKRRVTKLKKGGKDRADELVTFDEWTLTYESAQAMRIRCAETLIQYMHSKMPIAVDARVRADFTLIEEIVEPSDDVPDGEFEEIEFADGGDA